MVFRLLFSELDLENGNALLWANQIFQQQGNPFPGSSALFVRHRVLNAIAVFDALGKCCRIIGYIIALILFEQYKDLYASIIHRQFSILSRSSLRPGSQMNRLETSDKSRVDLFEMLRVLEEKLF